MKTINIVLCACKKHLENNEWRPYTELEDVILKRIREQLPKAKVNLQGVEVPLHLKEKNEFRLTAKIKDREYKIIVGLKLSRCNTCSKEGTNYFEGILQIRSPNQAVLEEGVKYLQGRVHNLRHRGMFINKVERFDDGFDLYITNKKIGQVLAKELQENFGGKLKQSPTLFTRNKQTSKDVYRLNIFLEMPGFGRHDIISVEDKVYLVEKIGKKIKMIDLQSGMPVIMEYDKMDYMVLRKHQAFVSRTYPNLEVINPLDFQSSMVRNKPKKSFTSGQLVNVVIHKGIYVVD